MKVNICLKEVLKSKDLDKFGVIQRMAKDLGINRHAISKIYKNKTSIIHLELLGKILTWLKNEGFSIDELLGPLFGTQPSKFWEAMGIRKAVTIYLGEYQQTEGSVSALRWISRRDSMVAAYFVQQLSAYPRERLSEPQLYFKFVPFSYGAESYEVDKEPLEGDMKRTKEIFKTMKNDSDSNASVIIGSQNVNYLLEYFVADLFGCKPFVLSEDSCKVPFFWVYKPRDRKMPSCFGGVINPFSKPNASVPGLHYMGKRNRWIPCRWIEGKEDAGLVITVHHQKNKAIEVVIAGFTGRATEVLGNQLILKEDFFWPPKVTLPEKEIGVYICKFCYEKDDSIKDGEWTAKDLEVISIDEKILSEYIC